MTLETQESASLSEQVTLVAKKDTKWWEFHIMYTNNDRTTKDIIHCFDDQSQQESDAIIYPSSSPRDLGIYQEMIMSALVHTISDNQINPYTHRKKSLIKAFLQTYKKFDPEKDQTIVMWKEIQQKGGNREDSLEELNKITEEFQWQKEQYRSIDSEIKKIHKQEKKTTKDSKIINEILSHPQSNELIKKCTTVMSLISEIKSIEEKIDKCINIRKGRENKKKEIENQLIMLSSSKEEKKSKKINSRAKKKNKKINSDKIKHLQNSRSQIENKIDELEWYISLLRVKLYDTQHKKWKALLKISQSNTVIGNLFNRSWLIDWCIDSYEKNINDIQKTIDQEYNIVSKKKNILLSIDNNINIINAKIIKTSNEIKGIKEENKRKNKRWNISDQSKKIIEDNSKKIQEKYDQINRFKKDSELYHQEQERITYSLLSPNHRKIRDDQKKKINESKKLINELNRQSNESRERSYKREREILIKDINNTIAQSEYQIKVMSQTIFDTDIKRVKEHEQEKNKLWRRIVSLKESKITTHNHLYEYIALIASINNKYSIDKDTSPTKEMLSHQITEYKQQQKIAENTRNEVYHVIKQTIAKYVLEWKRFQASIEQWMKCVTEFYQMGIWDKWSEEIQRKIKMLAYIRSNTIDTMDKLKKHINKNELMFLNTWSWHNQDIMILYNNINNLLQRDQTQEDEKNKTTQELVRIQAKTRKIDWTWFADGEWVYEQWKTKEEWIHDLQWEEDIEMLEKKRKKNEAIIDKITHNGNVNNEKTQARIDTLQQENDNIYKIIKSSSDNRSNQAQNKDWEGLWMSQNNEWDTKMIALHKRKEILEATIKTYETKKAMIQYFKKILSNKNK